MNDLITTLTERGQTSLPASIRRDLGLRPGQKLIWQKVSDTECRVIVQPRTRRLGARAMRGFMKRFELGRGWPQSTDEWLKLLREGEKR
jgi:AbrB family looped-hinge helix DNA binding protein